MHKHPSTRHTSVTVAITKYFRHMSHKHAFLHSVSIGLHTVRVVTHTWYKLQSSLLQSIKLTGHYPVRGGQGNLRAILSLWTLAVRHFVSSFLSASACPSSCTYVRACTPLNLNEEILVLVYPHATREESWPAGSTVAGWLCTTM